MPRVRTLATTGGHPGRSLAGATALGQLLLEREEEARGQANVANHRLARAGRPVAAHATRADLEEGEAGDAGDQQPDADRDGALGQGRRELGARCVDGGFHQTGEASGTDPADGDQCGFRRRANEAITPAARRRRDLANACARRRRRARRSGTRRREPLRRACSCRWSARRARGVDHGVDPARSSLVTRPKLQCASPGSTCSRRACGVHPREPRVLLGVRRVLQALTIPQSANFCKHFAGVPPSPVRPPP